MQHMQSKQIELGSSKHLPLDQLQAIDLAFDLPLAPRQGESSFDRSVISSESFCQSLQRSNIALLDTL